MPKPKKQKATKPQPAMLGKGMAKDAAKAMKGRQSRIDAAVDAASGKGKFRDK